MPRQASQELILLISNNPDDVAFTQELAQICSADFCFIGNLNQIEERVRSASGLNLFIDHDAKDLDQYENAIRQLRAEYPEKLSPNVIHYIAGSVQKLDNVRDKRKSFLGGSIILRRYGPDLESPQTAAQHFSRVLRKPRSPASFGLQNQLAAGTPMISFRFDKSQQKTLGVNETEAFLLKSGIPPRITSLIAMAVDEILLNAVFDAPSDETGNQIYCKLPRRTNLELPRNKSVELHVGVDGEYIGVSIVDYFGTLNRSTVLERALQVVNREYAPNADVENGGLGLAMVVRSGGSFFFDCERKVKTEVNLFFKRVDRFRAFTTQFQFISTRLNPAGHER